MAPFLGAHQGAASRQTESLLAHPSFKEATDDSSSTLAWLVSVRDPEHPLVPLNLSISEWHRCSNRHEPNFRTFGHSIEVNSSNTSQVARVSRRHSGSRSRNPISGSKNATHFLNSIRAENKDGSIFLLPPPIHPFSLHVCTDGLMRRFQRLTELTLGDGIVSETSRLARVDSPSRGRHEEQRILELAHRGLSIVPQHVKDAHCASNSPAASMKGVTNKRINNGHLDGQRLVRFRVAPTTEKRSDGPLN